MSENESKTAVASDENQKLWWKWLVKSIRNHTAPHGKRSWVRSHPRHAELHVAASFDWMLTTSAWRCVVYRFNITSIPRHYLSTGKMTLAPGRLPCDYLVNFKHKWAYMLNWGRQRCHLVTESESRRAISLILSLLPKKPRLTTLAVGPVALVSPQPSTWSFTE